MPFCAIGPLPKTPQNSRETGCSIGRPRTSRTPPRPRTSRFTKGATKGPPQINFAASSRSKPCPPKITMFASGGQGRSQRTEVRCAVHACFICLCFDMSLRLGWQRQPRGSLSLSHKEGRFGDQASDLPAKCHFDIPERWDRARRQSSWCMRAICDRPDPAYAHSN